MDAASLPVCADDIDAEWLSRALRAEHPGVDVASVTVVDRSEVTNSHARLAVEYRTADGAPTTLFCKLLPAGDRRAAIAATQMGPREARFYTELAPMLDLRVPHAYVAMLDPVDGAFVLLLQNMLASLSLPGTWMQGFFC